MMKEMGWKTLTIGFESISQVMLRVCLRAALMIFPSYWHDGGSNVITIKQWVCFDIDDDLNPTYIWYLNINRYCLRFLAYYQHGTCIVHVFSSKCFARRVTDLWWLRHASAEVADCCETIQFSWLVDWLLFGTPNKRQFLWQDFLDRDSIPMKVSQWVHLIEQIGILRKYTKNGRNKNRKMSNLRFMSKTRVSRMDNVGALLFSSTGTEHAMSVPLSSGVGR